MATVRSDNDLESTLLLFQRDGTTMCLVSDGHSPVGIVTIEDILEQVVGRIEDEYPQYPTVALRDLVLTDDALLNLSGQTVEQAIAEMAGRIPADRLPPQANIAELAIARERKISTNVGMGVAIPHAQCPMLPSSLVIFGRSTDGVVFAGPPPERVHLLFLLITPAEQPEIQVLLLSQIARIAGNPETLRRLRAVSSASESGEILASADWGSSSTN